MWRWSNKIKERKRKRADIMAFWSDGAPRQHPRSTIFHPRPADLFFTLLPLTIVAGQTIRFHFPETHWTEGEVPEHLSNWPLQKKSHQRLISPWSGPNACRQTVLPPFLPFLCALCCVFVTPLYLPHRSLRTAGTECRIKFSIIRAEPADSYPGLFGYISQ